MSPSYHLTSTPVHFNPINFCDEGRILNKCAMNGFIREQKEMWMPPSENSIQIQIGVVVCSTPPISFAFICYRSIALWNANDRSGPSLLPQPVPHVQHLLHLSTTSASIRFPFDADSWICLLHFSVDFYIGCVVFCLCKWKDEHLAMQREAWNCAASDQVHFVVSWFLIGCSLKEIVVVFSEVACTSIFIGVVDEGCIGNPIRPDFSESR